MGWNQGWVVVTGASSGIGASIAQSVSQAGFSVHLVGRSQERLEQVSQTLKGKHEITPCDLSRRSEVARLIAKLKNEPLFALVNNAGIFQRTLFDDTDTSDWDAQWQTNLMAPVQLCLGLGPQLKESGHGRVINIASTLGLRPVASTSAYSAVKAAMVSWTKTLSLEWAPRVRVNVLCPGLVNTPIHSFHGTPAESQTLEQMRTLQPMARVGRPDDIAPWVVHLLSQEGDWVTGSVWTLDGGISL